MKKKKRENAYVNKLGSELVIGCYFSSRSYLYDEVMTNL